MFVHPQELPEKFWRYQQLVRNKFSYVSGRFSAAAMEEVKKIWRETDAVCFDVDSTLVKEEAIDELAKFVGKGEEVAKL